MEDMNFGPSQAQAPIGLTPSSNKKKMLAALFMLIVAGAVAGGFYIFKSTGTALTPPSLELNAKATQGFIKDQKTGFIRTTAEDQKCFDKVAAEAKEAGRTATKLDITQANRGMHYVYWDGSLGDTGTFRDLGCNTDPTKAQMEFMAQWNAEDNYFTASPNDVFKKVSDDGKTLINVVDVDKLSTATIQKSGGVIFAMIASSETLGFKDGNTIAQSPYGICDGTKSNGWHLFASHKTSAKDLFADCKPGEIQSFHIQTQVSPAKFTEGKLSDTLKYSMVWAYKGDAIADNSADDAAAAKKKADDAAAEEEAAKAKNLADAVLEGLTEESASKNTPKQNDDVAGAVTVTSTNIPEKITIPEKETLLFPVEIVGKGLENVWLKSDLQIEAPSIVKTDEKITFDLFISSYQEPGHYYIDIAGYKGTPVEGFKKTIKIDIADKDGVVEVIYPTLTSYPTQVTLYVGKDFAIPIVGENLDKKLYIGFGKLSGLNPTVNITNDDKTKAILTGTLPPMAATGTDTITINRKNKTLATIPVVVKAESEYKAFPWNSKMKVSFVSEGQDSVTGDLKGSLIISGTTAGDNPILNQKFTGKIVADEGGNVSILKPYENINLTYSGFKGNVSLDSDVAGATSATSALGGTTVIIPVIVPFNMIDSNASDNSTKLRLNLTYISADGSYDAIFTNGLTTASFETEIIVE